MMKSKLKYNVSYSRDNVNFLDITVSKTMQPKNRD